MIRREAAIFLVVGSTTVLIDFCAYFLLLKSGLPVAWAKAMGFVTGMAFAYVANRLWTFGHVQTARASAVRFVTLYLATLLLNVLANQAMLMILKDWTWSVQAAFLIATGASAVTNFLGMKLFVFRGARDVHAGSTP